MYHKKTQLDELKQLSFAEKSYFTIEIQTNQTLSFFAPLKFFSNLI